LDSVFPISRLPTYAYFLTTSIGPFNYRRLSDVRGANADKPQKV